MRQRVATAALLLGVAITAVLGTAPAAQAAPKDIMIGYYPGGNIASSVSFYASGEHGDVCDWKADNHSALGVVEWSDGEHWHVIAVVWASRGAGTCDSYNVGIVDGTKVRAHACTGERATNHVIGCGKWETGEA